MERGGMSLIPKELCPQCGRPAVTLRRTCRGVTLASCALWHSWAVKEVPA